MSSVKAAVPVLWVKDVAHSLAWYKRILGFDGDGFPPHPPHGFGILRLNDVEIMLQCAEIPVPRTPHPYEWNVYLRLEGVNMRELHTKLAGLGIVTRRLERMPYGQIEFEIADPDGYVIVLSQEPNENEDMSDIPTPQG